MNKFLAGDFQILAESPDRDSVYTGSPCLAQLPSGRLVASYEWFRPQPPLVENIPDQLEVLVSDDDGVNWRKTAALDIIWPSLFVVKDTLFCIGNARLNREIIIARSEDGGESWSEPSQLFGGRHHNAPTSILFRNGYVYRAFETCPVGDDAVGRSQWESLVVAGDLERAICSTRYGVADVQQGPLSRRAGRAQPAALPGERGGQGGGRLLH